jgi:hypothetical protein
MTSSISSLLYRQIPVNSKKTLPYPAVLLRIFTCLAGCSPGKRGYCSTICHQARFKCPGPMPTALRVSQLLPPTGINFTGALTQAPSRKRPMMRFSDRRGSMEAPRLV